MTTREKEVLKLICTGMSNNEIGKQLFITTHTVKAHVGSIIEKFEVRNKIEIAYITGKLNLLE